MHNYNCTTTTATSILNHKPLKLTNLCMNSTLLHHLFFTTNPTGDREQGLGSNPGIIVAAGHLEAQVHQRVDQTEQALASVSPHLECGLHSE